MQVLGLDHVQLAIPRACEDEARAFYTGLLGLDEIPKPEALRARGGVWFRAGEQQLHLGVLDEPFPPPSKVHVGLVLDDLDAARARLAEAGIAYDDDGQIEGVDRLFVRDPFGNRFEFRRV